MKIKTNNIFFNYRIPSAPLIDLEEDEEIEASIDAPEPEEPYKALELSDKAKSSDSDNE